MTRVRWSVQAFERLRRLPEVDALLAERARAIAEACGGAEAGYEHSQTSGRTRSRASVITATPEAQADNASSQTLLRGLDAGRG